MNLRLIVGAVFVVVGIGIYFWSSRGGADAARAPAARSMGTAPSAPAPKPAESAPPTAPPATAATPGQLSAAKAAQVDRIKRDYEELALKLGEEFAAAGANFPGGLNAYLRQLALLEQEKRADYAKVLTPVELEDLELRETAAGRAVQRWLGDAVGEEQRRAVFRLQRDFDDRFSLIFDVSPAGLLRREIERANLRQKIEAALGPEHFRAWLRSEGADYEALSAYVHQQGLPAERAVDLWRVKNELVLRQLELSSHERPSDDAAAHEARIATQQREALDRAIARIRQLIGDAAFDAAPPSAFGWLRAR